MLDFIALAQQCAPLVAPQTMAAIVKTESAFRPLAIGVNKAGRLARQPKTVEEAVVTAKWLIDNGYNIDLGLGQVNSANLRKTGLTVNDAFDPCKNLAASAMILQGNYENASRRIVGKQAALHAAISAYNTGNFTAGFSNGYVQRVLNNAGTTTSVTPKMVMPIPFLTNPNQKTRTRLNPKKEVIKEKQEAEAAPALAPLENWNVYQSSNQNEMVF